MFTEDEKVKLWKGDVVDVGNKRYKLCPGCHRALNVSGFFGELHLCSKEEDREANYLAFQQQKKRFGA